MSANCNSYEMAVAMNNFAVMTLLQGGEGSYKEACQTMKNSIQLIKTNLSNNNGDCLRDCGHSNVPTTRICPFSYQCLNVPTSATSHPTIVHTISNCSPCPNLQSQSSTLYPPAEESSTSYFVSSTANVEQRQNVGSTPSCVVAGVGNGRWKVYPMHIDDYDATSLGQASQVEYHATVMLYNLAIVNLLTEIKISDRTTVLPNTKKESDIAEVEMSPLRMQSALKIFQLALSHLKQLIQPYFDYLASYAREDMTDETIMNRSVCMNDDLYSKCIILMILIHHHIMNIIQLLPCSDSSHQYYVYHRSMMNQLVSVLSYIDLFIVPMSLSLSCTTSGSNPRQYTSPAA